MTQVFFGNFLWALSKPFSGHKGHLYLGRAVHYLPSAAQCPLTHPFCCRAEWWLKRIHSKPSLHQPPVATEFSELWLNAFWCYPSGMMNNCLLEGTDVILFTSTCQRQVHISTVIIFYFLVCRFWLGSWACNSMAPFACRRRFGTWSCFVLSTLPHTSSCWSTLVGWHCTPCFICWGSVTSLKDWKVWGAVLLPPVFIVYF